MNRKHRLAQQQSARLAGGAKASKGINKSDGNYISKSDKPERIQKLIDRAIADVDIKKTMR